MIAAIWASVAGSSDRSTGDYLKEWPEEFHEARIVNLAHRSLRAVPPTIPEGCFLQLLQLDLSHNHLQEFPEAVLNIPALEQLNVESNCLRSIPETLPDCKSLMSLFCGFNFIREIPCCLSSPESMPRLCAVFIQENYIDIGKIPKANRNVFHGVEHQRVPQNVIPGFLWLGSKAAASDIRELQILGITDILTVSGSIPPRYPECFNYKIISVHDVPTANISASFDDCLTFLEVSFKSNTKRRVLVHCNQGVSRSATLVIAHIMKSQQKGFEEALGLVKQRRYVANPNTGFRNQLKQFEAELQRSG